MEVSNIEPLMWMLTGENWFLFYALYIPCKIQTLHDQEEKKKDDAMTLEFS